MNREIQGMWCRRVGKSEHKLYVELEEAIYNPYPLAELNKRIFKSANRFVVNVVYILKDCKCTYFP